MSVDGTRGTLEEKGTWSWSACFLLQSSSCKWGSQWHSLQQIPEASSLWVSCKLSWQMPHRNSCLSIFSRCTLNFTIQGQGGTFCDEAWLVAGEGDFAKFFLPQVLCLSLEDMALWVCPWKYFFELRKEGLLFHCFLEEKNLAY